jgi:two-component system, sensor histidine kinase RegB
MHLMSLVRAPARRFSLLDSLGETATQKNALLLIQLRWLAVLGQASTIVLGTVLFDLALPMPPMFGVIGGLVLLNLFSMLRPRLGGEVRSVELMAGLFLDISALTALLYFSGGASNPFVFLYVLQVTLGAILLKPRQTWLLVAWSCLCFAALTRWSVPLTFSTPDHPDLFALHVDGMFVCYVLVILLLVLFIGRIGANIRRRDQRLADLRQQAAEEDHIVRMGLLASGAAHELGTPLATLSVILGDWRHLPEFRDHPERREELEDMDAELRRIKGIVGGILMSAGEARGEATELTTAAQFLDQLVTEWRSLSPACTLDYAVDAPLDVEAFRRTPIVAGPALRQVIFNVLDNAREVSPDWVGLSARCRDGELALTVRDRGPGFAPEMLERLGKPYQSSKSSPGRGLGLFLVVNVLRKLGGRVEARNDTLAGGAEVQLILPLSAVAIAANDAEGEAA